MLLREEGDGERAGEQRAIASEDFRDLAAAAYTAWLDGADLMPVMQRIAPALLNAPPRAATSSCVGNCGRNAVGAWRPFAWCGAPACHPGSATAEARPGGWTEAEWTGGQRAIRDAIAKLLAMLREGNAAPRRERGSTHEEGHARVDVRRVRQDGDVAEGLGVPPVRGVASEQPDAGRPPASDGGMLGDVPGRGAQSSDGGPVTTPGATSWPCFACRKETTYVLATATGTIRCCEGSPACEAAVRLEVDRLLALRTVTPNAEPADPRPSADLIGKATRYLNRHFPDDGESHPDDLLCLARAIRSRWTKHLHEGVDLRVVLLPGNPRSTADLTDWGVCSVLKLWASRFTSAKERA